MDPDYDECGEFCGDKQELQNFYCETCPMLQAQQQFEQETLEWLDQRAKDQWQEFGFPILLQAVLDSYKFDKVPLEFLTVRSAQLIQARDQQAALKKRKEIWLEKLKRQNENNSE